MPESEFQPQERLHPMSWLFGAITFIRQFIVPLIAAALFGSRDGAPSWLAFMIVPLVIAALWKQYFYRYGFGPDGLVIREGVLFHNIRQIDYGRIENVDTERGVLHRLLGVTEVKVETSTGGKPEALIQVLSLEAAEALRRQVFARRGAEIAEQETAPPPSTTLLHLPPLEVVKFGLIDNRGMVVVAGLFGLLYEIGALQRLGILLRERLDLQLFDQLIAGSYIIQAGVALAVLLAIVLLLRVFSVALALLTLHDFELTQTGADLKARYGLLTRVSLTVRLARIQAVHQTQTLLHRLFGRVSLRVDLAGGGGSTEPNEDAAKAIRWLAPVVEPEQAHNLIATALPDIDLDAAPEWRSLARGARGRIFRRSAAWWSIVGIGLAVALKENYALLLAALGVPLSWWYATMYVRHTGWALRPDVLLFRSGWLTRTLVVVPRDRIQTAHWHESPFDRRHAMASVSVDTAGAGSRTGPVRIPYLDKEIAIELAHTLYLSAAGEPSRSAQYTERALT